MTRRWKYIFTISMIVGMFILVSTIIVIPGMARNTIMEMFDSFTVYLPTVLNKYPFKSVFGVTLTKIDAASGLDQLTDAGITWTRREVIWSSIEPVEGQRIWDSSLDLEIINAAIREIDPILIIGGTPQWALQEGFNCGAVDEGKFTALGLFAYDLVKRYSAAPYNVHYWELWNEPDAAGGLGCWGNPSDTQYYGGYYYGQMLQVVYPMIKAADPQAQVLVGGLLLDCDPINSPEGMNCTPSKFLKGILESGAGNSFDGVAFHAYDYYTGLGKYGFSNWNSSSSTTGPSAIAKGRYLKQVLTQYGAENKYLMNTETAVFYGPNVMTPPCDANAPADVEITKVYHLIHSYSSAIAEGYKANVWFSAIGVRCSGLLNEDLSGKPVFEAYKFTYQKLRDVTFIRSITSEYPQLMGYEFQMGNRILWVIWSKDGTDQAITLPKDPVLINKIGADGIAVQEANTTLLTVGMSPYFIEFNN